MKRVALETPSQQAFPPSWGVLAKEEEGGVLCRHGNEAITNQLIIPVVFVIDSL